MNKVLYFGIMAGATAIAALATWKYAKEKYSKEANEDIAEMKAYYKDKYESNSEGNAPDTNEEKKSQPKTPAQQKAADMKAYRKMTREKYNADHEDEVGHPYVISPDIFGENPGYDRITLTYYADHILADENDEVIRDVEETVGFESLTHFGEYEADIVHVENDILRCYYEITRDLRKYVDVAAELPSRPEVD